MTQNDVERLRTLLRLLKADRAARERQQNRDDEPQLERAS